MAISVQSQATALNPGSDLWIVPDLERSRWTTKLDWYLNFQLCKATRHKSATLPEFVDTVLAETELPKPKFELQSTLPLMIASENLLPNKWIVMIPWQEDMGQWTKSIVDVWSQLNQPTLRVFLPPGQSAGQIQQHWQKHHGSQEFTVVLD